MMSAISTNCRSRIFLTSFVDRTAAREGVVDPNGHGVHTIEAVAARTSSPEGTVWDLEKSGIVKSGVTVVVLTEE